VPNYISNPPFPYASASDDRCQLNEGGITAVSHSGATGKYRLVISGHFARSAVQQKYGFGS